PRPYTLRTRRVLLGGNARARRAEFRKPTPHGVGAARRVVQQRPHMARHACLFGEELPHGVAKRDLLVCQLQVHRRGSPRTRVAVMPLLIWVVPPAMVSDRDDRRRSTQRWPALSAPSTSNASSASSCPNSDHTLLARLADPSASPPCEVADSDRFQRTSRW